MDKTRLSILESINDYMYDLKGDDKITVDEALEAMKIAMKQAYFTGMQNGVVIDHLDREGKPHDKSFDEYLNKLEEQK